MLLKLYRNKPYFELFLVSFLALAILTWGKYEGDALRGFAINLFAPLWSRVDQAAHLWLVSDQAPIHRGDRQTARVIYRTPSLWNSSLWIDAGAPVVSLNSPVLKQGALIGVIDYVGPSHSRVRLITDARLNPAVRVLRGALKKQQLLNDIDLLIQDLTYFVETPEERGVRDQILPQLNSLKEIFFPVGVSWYLAKGYLQGSSLPLSKSDPLTLKGIGFNLDFQDSRSPPRDLRTGVTPHGPKMPIIQTNDLLITSGLDALFPEGLPVAIVTHVDPLEEGDTYYTLEALPVAKELFDLYEVDILPPIGVDPTELPPQRGFLRA